MAISAGREFAKRLDRVLAALIQLYQPAYFTRVGLRYINAIDRAALGLEDCLWRELIQPGYLALSPTRTRRNLHFSKCELSASLNLPGGAKANVKSGPGTLRKVNNRTKEATETRASSCSISTSTWTAKRPLGQTAPALNIVHGNAGSPLPRRRDRHAAGRHGAGTALNPRPRLTRRGIPLLRLP